MKLALAFMILAAQAAPSWAQAPDQPYRDAVQARLAGDPARAAALLEDVVAKQPDNADAQLQLGLAFLAMNRLDEAEAAFRHTLAIAPGYSDARVGLARVEQRRGDNAAAAVELEQVAPGNTDAAILRRQLVTAGAIVPRYRWRADIDASHSELTRGRSDWNEASLRLTHQASPATAVSGAVEVAQRFGLTDTYGELRVERRLKDGSIYAFAGGTPKADFRPEWQLGLGGEVRLRSGDAATVLTLDARQVRYAAGDIQTLNPGIDQYLAGGRAWIGFRWINIFDEGRHQSGWLGRGDWLASDRLRLFAGAADAPDTSEGVVVDTFSLFGGLSYDATERLTVRASLAHEDRESGPKRVQFGLGVGLKF